MTKAFYVDLVRGSKFSLLAGPFPSEEIARKYEGPAAKLAMDLDPWAAFDAHGVMSLETEDQPKFGVLNGKLPIDPRDILRVDGFHPLTILQ